MIGTLRVFALVLALAGCSEAHMTAENQRLAVEPAPESQNAIAQVGAKPVAPVAPEAGAEAEPPRTDLALGAFQRTEAVRGAPVGAPAAAQLNGKALGDGFLYEDDAAAFLLLPYHAAVTDATLTGVNVVELRGADGAIVTAAVELRDFDVQLGASLLGVAGEDGAVTWLSPFPSFAVSDDHAVALADARQAGVFFSRNAND